MPARPASSPSISTPSSPTGASWKRRRCRPNAPAWSRPMPMAAAPNRWRARCPTPAARPSSSRRWMKRRVVRGAVPASAAIYVLDGFFQNSGEAYAKINCRPVIGDLNELAEWDVFCRRSGWNGGAAIHIDTGMNRLGLTVARSAGHHPPHQCRRSRHHAGDEPSGLRRAAQQPDQRQAARGLPRDRQPVLGRAGGAVELVGNFLGRAIPVRPGAPGRCALRHQPDAGSRQSDAAVWSS